MQTTTHRLFAALLTSLAIAGFGWAAAPVITQVSTWGETYNTDWAGYYTTSNASIYLTAADSDGDIDFSSSELWPVEHELAYQSVMDYQTFDKWGGGASIGFNVYAQCRMVGTYSENWYAQAVIRDSAGNQTQEWFNWQAPFIY